jgi:hypothetical protein
MFVDQLSASPHHRLNQILHTLKHVHACELPVHDVHKLSEWASDAIAEKQQIVQDQDFNSYMQQPAYVKASLILEAVKMLTEIAPRRRKRVKEHKETSMPTLNEAKAAKPDFLDLDKDGDRKESMKQAAKQAKHKEVDEAKQDPEADRLRDEWMAKKAPTYGNTRVAKGAKFHRPGSGHVGRTGSASADAPGIKPTSIKVKDRVLQEDINLDKAQTLLAAQDISDRLQKMAEDAAKMAVDDLMPLVDTMKDQFGLEAATAFNNVVKQQLQTVLDSIIAAKDQTDNAINTMEAGGMPAAPVDIAQPLPPMGAPTPAAPAATPADQTATAPEGEIDFEKEFAATPAGSGPEEEPLGRAKKEVAEAIKKEDLLAPIANAAMTGKDEKGRPVDKKAAQETLKALMKESKKAMQPGAVATAQVKKMGEKYWTGENLTKAGITKRDKIIRAMEKDLKEQQLTQIRSQVHALKERFEHVKESYSAHVRTLSENWIQNQGDLQSAVLQNHMRMIRTQINELVETHKQLKAELLESARFQAQTHRKVAKLDQQLTSEPWGVRGQYTYGERFRKFFESAVSRDTWLRYNEDHIKVMETIDPEHVKAVKNRLLDQI